MTVEREEFRERMCARFADRHPVGGHAPAGWDYRVDESVPRVSHYGWKCSACEFVLWVPVEWLPLDERAYVMPMIRELLDIKRNPMTEAMRAGFRADQVSSEERERWARGDDGVAPLPVLPAWQL